MELARKFTIEDIRYRAQASGFQELSAWRNGTYDGQMLLSNVEVLTQCWHDSDNLFQGFSDWSVKPIEVRHPFCFYYGHLASFMKLKMLPEEPVCDMDSMFSRGIDPVISDPSQCHTHPEIPPAWPTREEIVAYVKGAREKVLEALVVQRGPMDSRLISLTLEHDRLHQETLTYMMAQNRKANFENSATAATTPQWLQHPNGAMTSLNPPTTMSIAQSLAKSKMVRIDAGAVVLGADVSRISGFLWDNEYPQFQTAVSSPFFVNVGPVSIGEFYRFVLECGYDKETLWDSEDFELVREKGLKFPATWSCVKDEIYVHEPQATNHWSKVAHQPVFVSLSEAEAFCRWVGCRVMTEAEYQRILDVLRDDDVDKEKVQQMRSGGWEWTSTPFEPFPGFEAMAEYPEYSTDFFGGKHFVLKGASPATHLSMRRDSFRNFYQRQYPYAFAKFRCCR